MHLETLNNGLKVAFIPSCNLDSISIHLRGRVGSNHERLDEISSAHVAEHIKLSNPQRNKLISNGAKIYGITSRDNVLFMVKSLKEYLIDDLNFLSDILINKNIQNLDKFKELCRQEMLRTEQDLEKRINTLSYRLLFPNQRLGKPNTGSVKDLDTLKLSKLQNFIERQYTVTNFVLVGSGDIDSKLFTKYSKNFFGNLPAGIRTKEIEWKKNKDLTVFAEKTDHKSTLVKISYYGLNSNDKSKISLEILADIMDQALKLVIKETLGYSYNIYCSTFSSESYGFFSICFSCADSNVAFVFREIKNIINDVGKYITPRSVLQSQKRLTSQLAYDFEKNSLRADFYSNALLCKNKVSYESVRTEILRCKTEDIIRTAETIFTQNPKIAVLSRTLKELDILDYWKK